jgi:DNA-binding XRE family transcriptional regulator
MDDGYFSDVRADHCEVAVRQFKNIRATIGCDRLRAVGVRVRAETAEELNRRVHCAATIGEHIGKRKAKYSVYTVVCLLDSGFRYRVGKIPKHRKILGENIRHHRQSLKWSQEKLAEKADLHRNYVGDIERGEENVSVDTLARIAAALKVPLPDLLRDA